MRPLLLLLVVVLFGCRTPAPEPGSVENCYQVLYVRDGDTLYLAAAGLSACVRLARIDCPELPSPEGIAARDYVRDLLPVGTVVRAVRLGRDHYGRNLCLVYLPDGRELTALLLATGHAQKLP